MMDMPFDRRGWDGEAISVDGTDASIPESDAAIAEWLYQYDSGEGWDGECCGVVRLQDGRLMAWESWWGPTGSGFSQDAYGGNADVYFASDLGLLVNAALGDEMRRLAAVPQELWNQ